MRVLRSRRVAAFMAIAVAQLGLVMAVTATSAGAATITQQFPDRSCAGDHDLLTWAPQNVQGLTGYEIIAWGSQYGNSGNPTFSISDVGPNQTSLAFTASFGGTRFDIYTVTSAGRADTPFDSVGYSAITTAFPHAWERTHVSTPTSNTVGDHTATVEFGFYGFPDRNGASEVVASVTITASPGGATRTIAPGQPLIATFDHLTNGLPYTFTAIATNACGSGGPVTSQPFIPGLLNVSTSRSLSAATGRPYSQQLSANPACLDTSGQICSPANSYAWPLTGSLPPGLSSGTFTGQVAGIPTQPGVYTFTFTAYPYPQTGRVADQQTDGSPATFTLTVGDVGLSSSPSGSVVGAPVTFTANATSSAGTFRFYDGTTLLGSKATTNGKASLVAKKLARGHHSITATFTPKGSTTPTSSPAFDQQVDPASTTVSLMSSANPTVVGQTTNITALVHRIAPATGTAASGTVTFYDQGVALGSRTLAGGKATLSAKFVAAGAHAITATYSGDGTDQLSSTTTPLMQTVDPATTALTSTVAPNPALAHHVVTLKAVVRRVAPATGTVTAGSVSFFDNGTLLTSVPIVNGAAVYKTSGLTTGTHPITARYSGSTSDKPSTSAVVNELIT